MTSKRSVGRTCFVTVGATTGFQDLIAAVLHPDFAKALIAKGYTHLIVQHGNEGKKHYTAASASLAPFASQLEVVGFPVDPAGLHEYMVMVKGGANAGGEGVIISHAGSGTILAAMRLALPIIVVPNERLLDNHQVELAEVLEAQGYVVRGHVDSLPAALSQVETLRQGLSDWPPTDSESGGGLQAVMDEEMGFLD